MIGYMARAPFSPVVPCHVCGEPAWILVNVGSQAGRYFCQEHDPITIDYLKEPA